MEFTKSRLLLVAAVVAMFVVAFFAGRMSISQLQSPEAAAYAGAAAFLQKDKNAPSFCELSERARMYVCPAVRKVVAMPGDGHIVIYKCRADGLTGGYVEMTNMSEETKIMIRSQSAQQGVRLRKLCEQGTSEVYRVIGSAEDDQQSI